jgi:hypothetical protein
MSLTSVGPEKFSTTPRKQLMAKTPEDEIPENTLRREKRDKCGKDAGNRANLRKD